MEKGFIFSKIHYTDSQYTAATLTDAECHHKSQQDWPVASELVPGGMYFPFCLQRARYDNPIRQKVPRENQWNKTSSSGVSK